MPFRRGELAVRVLAGVFGGLLLVLLGLPVVSLVLRISPGLLLDRLREALVIEALRLSLVTSIAATDKLRAQKSLSLNLAQRKQEREALDAEQLRLENQRRTAQGKAPFSKLEDLQTADDVTGDKAPDILLDSTYEITADLVADSTAAKPPARTVAKRQEKTEPAPQPAE